MLIPRVCRRRTLHRLFFRCLGPHTTTTGLHLLQAIQMDPMPTLQAPNQRLKFYQLMTGIDNGETDIEKRISSAQSVSFLKKKKTDQKQHLKTLL
jgi:hypothetical protein